MPVRVMVVDDSAFFRRQISSLLSQDPELEIVGSAINGEQAVRRAKRLNPDIITMDVEMPVMDGITAVRHIMKDHPTPIVILSALTQAGAQSSLDALEAGAVEVMPKPQGEDARDPVFFKQFTARLKALSKNGIERPGQAVVNRKPHYQSPEIRNNYRKNKELEVIVIGSSTGGPVVAQQVLAAMPGNFQIPVVLIQHMPSSFMQSFADRLDRVCPLKVVHAKHGDVLEAGHVYVAPGGIHTEIIRRQGKLMLQTRPKLPTESFCPSVDIAFSSASQCCPGRVLGIVFTGMGADGCEGAKDLKASRSEVWAQSEESCTIYGMPRAVIEAKLADHVFDVPGFCSALQELEG